MKKQLIALMSVSALLAACSTFDPYTGERQTSTAIKGSAIGGIIGAVAGAATGDNATERRQRALIGLGVGALSGAAVGAYMDRQEAALRAELQGSGVSVTRDGDNVTLNMPGNVTFQTDSEDLQSQFFRVLDSVGKVLNEYESTVVRVEGHTDSTGAREYNQALSERRASTVATYLHTRGVKQERFLAIGYGQDQPIDSNATVAGRQANRRVEITLVPITQ